MKTGRAKAEALGIQHALSWLARSRLASTAEGRSVSFAAFAQGLVLVTFPVVNRVLTDLRGYGISGEIFGDLIVPAAAAAIVASLTGCGLACRHTTRHAYRLGLTLSLLSMVLLIASGVVQGNLAATVPLMLVASVCLGAGFGLTVPVLTAYARFLNPTTEYSNVVVLHALLGLGALVAPAVAAISTSLGLWWGFPALSAALLMTLLLVSGRMPSGVGAPTVAAAHARRRIVRFSLYTMCIMIYAVSVAVLVIWSQLNLTHHLRLTKVAPVAPVHLASAFSLVHSVPGLGAALVFGIFWGGLLTAGRVLLAAVDQWQSPPGRAACYFGPILVLSALIVAGVLSHHRLLAAIAIFGLAVFGCSALMPLKLGIGGQRDVTAISAALAGGVVAYRLGYLIVAAGLRPDLHAGLPSLLFFAAAVVVGIPMVVVAFALVLGRPAELDPHRLGKGALPNADGHWPALRIDVRGPGGGQLNAPAGQEPDASPGQQPAVLVHLELSAGPVFRCPQHKAPARRKSCRRTDRIRGDPHERLGHRHPDRLRGAAAPARRNRWLAGLLRPQRRRYLPGRMPPGQGGNIGCLSRMHQVPRGVEARHGRPQRSVHDRTAGPGI